MVSKYLSSSYFSSRFSVYDLPASVRRQMEKLVMKNVIQLVHDVEVRCFKYALVYVNVCMHACMYLCQV
jgi:hypothetical protein